MKIREIKDVDAYYKQKEQYQTNSIRRGKDTLARAMEAFKKPPVIIDPLRILVGATYFPETSFWRRLLKNRLFIGLYKIEYNLYHNSKHGNRYINIWKAFSPKHVRHIVKEDAFSPSGKLQARKGAWTLGYYPILVFKYSKIMKTFTVTPK